MAVSSYPRFHHLNLSLSDGGVLEVTMNRPELLNAWNDDMVQDFRDLWHAVDRDGDVRVVVVTGAGEAFSVGGDYEHLDAMVSDTDEAVRGSVKDFVDIIRGMLDLDKPIIAAINGPAVGAGVTLALCCDISLMSDRAKILCGGQIKANLVPAEAPYLWPLLCGMAKAKYHIFCTDFLSAQEAERIGLISDVIPHDTLMERAREIAENLARRDPTALGWTKRAMNHWFRQAAPILDFSMAMEALGFRRPEATDALEKLREKQ